MNHIIISTEHIPGVMDGRITQARRMIRPRFRADEGGFTVREKNDKRIILKHDLAGNLFPIPRYVGCPYGNVGNRLAVREMIFGVPGEGAWYAADGAAVMIGDRPFIMGGLCSILPAKFIPAEASRITLEVIGVRVQQLHEMTAGDARAENGMPPISTELFPDGNEFLTVGRWQKEWSEIHATRDMAMELDPWCWVVSFERI